MKTLALVAALTAFPVLAQEVPPATEQLAVSDNWRVARDSKFCYLTTTSEGATFGVKGDAEVSHFYLKRDTWDFSGKIMRFDVEIDRLLDSNLTAKTLLPVMTTTDNELVSVDAFDAQDMFAPRRTVLQVEIIFPGTERPWRFNSVSAIPLVFTYNECVNSFKNNQIGSLPYSTEN